MKHTLWGGARRGRSAQPEHGQPLEQPDSECVLHLQVIDTRRVPFYSEWLGRNKRAGHGDNRSPTVTRDRQAPAAPPSDWLTFEAEALPHAESLFRLAMWFERDRREAEDLVQETMTRALEAFHRYEAGTNCRAWLVTILRHVRSNRRRASGRAPVAADSEERIAQTIAMVPAIPEQLTDEDVLAALQRLPLKYQEVVLLSDVEELSYKEVAEALAIPIGTVMSRLHRARALLRVELADYATAHGVRRAEGI